MEGSLVDDGEFLIEGVKVALVEGRLVGRIESFIEGVEVGLVEGRLVGAVEVALLVGDELDGT